MSAWLQQAKAMDDYAKLAQRFAVEYAAEGDEVRATRYADDAIWYGERASMYRERHQALVGRQEEAA
jgi:hypothetical protein